MKYILSYLRKWSSGSHVVFLVIFGALMLYMGKEVFGKNYWVVPLAAFVMAAIETIVLMTNKEMSERDVLVNTEEQNLIVTWIAPSENGITDDEEDKIRDLEEALRDLLENGAGEYDTTDSLENIQFLMLSPDAKVTYDTVKPILLGSPLRPFRVEATKYVPTSDDPYNMVVLFTDDILSTDSI